jgi:hypothetical protein
VSLLHQVPENVPRQIVTQRHALSNYYTDNMGHGTQPTACHTTYTPVPVADYYVLFGASLTLSIEQFHMALLLLRLHILFFFSMSVIAVLCCSNCLC